MKNITVRQHPNDGNMLILDVCVTSNMTFKLSVNNYLGDMFHVYKIHWAIRLLNYTDI